MRKPSNPKTDRKRATDLPKGNAAAPAPEDQFEIPSVETISRLAARLLNGEDSISISKAVNTALALWQQASEVHRLLNLARDADTTPSDKWVSYKVGAKYITGQKRSDRAVEYLQTFAMDTMVREMPKMKTDTQKRKALSALISEWENTGFPADRARELREKYQEFKKKSLR